MAHTAVVIFPKHLFLKPQQQNPNHPEIVWKKNLFGLLYLECNSVTVFKITWKEMGLCFVQVTGY